MYFTTHNVPFSWTPELQQELERKREAMKQPVKLSPLDLNKKMYAFWDAAVTVGVVSEIPFLCDKKDYFMRGARVVFIQSPRIWDSFPNQTSWASRTPDYSKWRKSFFPLPGGRVPPKHQDESPRGIMKNSGPTKVIWVSKWNQGG